MTYLLSFEKLNVSMSFRFLVFFRAGLDEA